MAYIGKSPNFGVRNRFIYTATGDETSISGADDSGATLTFEDGAYVDVYLNGILLKPTTDYNTSTANTIAGLSALSTDDIVEIIVYDVFSVSDTVSAASGGTFSGGVTVGSTLDVTGNVSFDGGSFVFNESSADVDFRVESDGNANMFVVDGGVNKIFIGHAADQAYDAGFTPAVQIAQVGNTVYGGIGMAHYSNDGEGSVLVMGSGRATSVTGTTIVADDDMLGRIDFQGMDGSDFETGAIIMANVDGTPGSDDMPARLTFWTTADGSHSATERMRIDAAGNIGIGGDPSSLFHVHGDSRSTNSTSGGVSHYFQNSTTGSGSTDGTQVYLSSDESFGLWNYETTYMLFATDNTERMRISSDGQIAMSADRGGAILHITNSHSSVPYGIGLDFSAASPDDNDKYFLHGEDSSANRFRVYSDGDVWTSDAGILTSDERLKNTITDATDKWDDVKKLKVRNFYWNEDYHPNKKDKKLIGFVAQEFETVFPKLVSEHNVARSDILYTDNDQEVKDKTKKIGDVKTEVTPVIRKAVKEGKLIPILTKALQEAMTRIETLETKVKALEDA